jgi:hypothetical protein
LRFSRFSDPISKRSASDQINDELTGVVKLGLAVKHDVRHLFQQNLVLSLDLAVLACKKV